MISLILLLFVFFTFTSCGENTEVPVTPPGNIVDDSGSTGKPDNPDNPNNPDNPDNPDDPNNPDNPVNPGPVITEVEFIVSLTYNKKTYIPEKDEVITVIWADDYSQYTQTIGEDGFAKKVLDGEFYVYLDNTPKGYTYDANIYVADNENPVIEIELLKIAKVSKGKGTALYSEYQLSSEGTYRSEIKKKNQKVYYEYQPKKSGYYVIESFVNVYADMVNPKVDIYTGTFAAKYFSETLDDGGKYLKGGYTRNFKWVVKLTQQELKNVYTFAVFADSKTGEYPVYVDFRISYEGEYYKESTLAKMMEAEEIKANTYCMDCAKFLDSENTPKVCPYCKSKSITTSTRTPDYKSTKYKFINSDHGTGSYYASFTNGTGYLEGDDFKYNEETGYWHVYDHKTKTYGPVLCAKITQPCAYYDESLNLIESHGNKNLTVSNLTENYKQFVEVQYAAICNSDGVCYVTNEMKEFLQKFSVSQRLFFDGNGFVESSGVYAIEEDQWLFACGWYEEK
jgi:hypothetical protein